MTATCQLRRRPGHAAEQCFSYHITKTRNAKPKGWSADEKISNEANEEEGTWNQMGKAKSRRCYVYGETDVHIARSCPQRKDTTEYTGKGGNARTLITKPVHTKSMSPVQVLQSLNRRLRGSKCGSQIGVQQSV